MNFLDFLTSFISNTPDTPLPSDRKAAQKKVDCLPHIVNSGHSGMCVGQSGPCELCEITSALNEWNNTTSKLDI